MDLQQLETLVTAAIQDGLKARVGREYGNPLDAIVKAAVDSRAEAIRGLVADAVDRSIASEEFRLAFDKAVQDALRHQLINGMGKEIAARVNALKSDPTLKLRLTAALDALIRQGPIASPLVGSDFMDRLRQRVVDGDLRNSPPADPPPA